MKHLIFALTAAVIAILIFVILFSLHSRDIRRAELERSLDAAAEQTLKKACVTDTYSIGDNDELISDFITSFLGKLKSDGKDIEVEILAADIYKGILSAHVTEKYTFPNGKKGTIEADTTAIVERESRRPTVCTECYLPWEVARAAGYDYTEGDDFLFYKRRVSEGYEQDDALSLPSVPGYTYDHMEEKDSEDGVRRILFVYK